MAGLPSVRPGRRVEGPGRFRLDWVFAYPAGTSSNGRTADSDSAYRGSNPCVPANFALQPSSSFPSLPAKMCGVTTTTPSLMLAVLTVALSCPAFALAQPQESSVCVAARGQRPPIIDVHMHATGVAPDSVIAELDRENVVAVVVSSLILSRTEEWTARDARFLPSLAFREPAIPLDRVRDLVQRHTVVALGELGFAYAGLRPDDQSLEPYFALAEELDVPVAIHMAGGGLPDVPAFRVRLGDP